MAEFCGNFNEFIVYINDYVKNKVPALTRKYKKCKCELCGSSKPLDAAHVRGLERETLIKQAFNAASALVKDDIYSVNLNVFAEHIKELHSDPNNFHFICRECHKQYDAPNNNIKESDFNRSTN